MIRHWNILTGEYPPHPGGVSDYTRLVAARLAADGEPVSVWTPSEGDARAPDDGVRVHRLPGGFGVVALAGLGRRLEAARGAGPLLVQYVPQAFGWRGMNLPFCLWLARRREPVWVMFHEVVFPREPSQPARHRLLASVTAVMARLVARAAERVFVSTPAWGRLVARLAPGAPPAEWLPVPSTIATTGDAAAARRLARLYAPHGPLIGHFGSCGPAIAGELARALPALLGRVPGAGALLLGAGGVALRRRIVAAAPALAARVWATGPLPAREVSTHLLACDVMLQPFVDGVTARRTSVMAALAHGVPVVTTGGRLTEPIWAETGAVALAAAGDPARLASVASALLESAGERQDLGRRGRAVYDAHFDIRHTVAALRAVVPAHAETVGW